ncbi:MAG: DUF2515 family protein [Tuberibacillus sp.]
MNLNDIQGRRRKTAYTKQDYLLIKKIRQLTMQNNADNVSRTHAYQKFYKEYPGIQWALLASMVSRNAGWNMTDLKSELIFRPISDQYIKILFHTYERPNWLIFHDAYPQLLLFAMSVKWQRPLFYLLKAFDVSLFMEAEWERFWNHRDLIRLNYALIVNEQHVIEEPVIRHPFYRIAVFENMFFKLEEWLRLSAVVFPDMSGSLYGFPVTRFQNVHVRIALGKKLHRLLFNSPVSKAIQAFALNVDHTGARYDYEQFHMPNTSAHRWELRAIFPVINHRKLQVMDWYNGEINTEWFVQPAIDDYDLTTWYRKRKKRLKRTGSFLKYILGK